MINWILANSTWLFSGIGVAVLSGLGALIRLGYRRWPKRSSLTGQSILDPSLALPTQQQVKPKTTISRFPSFLLRVLLKPEIVASKVHIDLRSENPIDLSLNTEVPRIDLYFRITNLSSLDLILDRLLLDVWFGQPTFTTALLRRYDVPAGQITEGIFLRHHLNSAQCKQIEEFSHANGQRGSLHIYLTAYFQSRAGDLEVHKSIDRTKVT